MATLLSSGSSAVQHRPDVAPQAIRIRTMTATHDDSGDVVASTTIFIILSRLASGRISKMRTPRLNSRTHLKQLVVRPGRTTRRTPEKCGLSQQEASVGRVRLGSAAAYSFSIVHCSG